MKLQPIAALSFHEMVKTVDSLRKADDAAIVTVTAAWLDDALAQLWRRRMLPRAKDQDALLQPEGPLGSLFAKAKLACMLGWLPHLDRELKHIRDIRNGFAHSRDRLSLARSPFREKCRALHIPDAYNAGGPIRPARSARQRLIISSLFATREVLRLAEASQAPRDLPGDSAFLHGLRREIKSATLRQILAALPDA